MSPFGVYLVLDPLDAVEDDGAVPTLALGFLAQNNTKVFWMLSKTKLMPFKKVRLSRALFTYI